MSGKHGTQLTREGAAKRLGVGVADLPDLGRPWTGRDVADAQRGRPGWLRSARKALGAARAEQERQRTACFDAVLARRSGFEYPPVTAAASDFARDSTTANLLTLLHDALDASAAETYVIDSGFDVSTHARRTGETHRERVKRGASLSGRDDESFAECGLDRAAGTLGDLFDAPTGSTEATFGAGAGFAAERWADAWYDRWALDGLAHAHVIADLVLRGYIETLEVIAGVPLSDVAVAVRRPFNGIADDALSLACEALHAWTEIDCPVLDPDEVVDMDAPISALPGILPATRRSWNRRELLPRRSRAWTYQASARIWWMANRGPDDYVSATAAAHRLGVSTRTLRRYTQEGRLPDARSAGGRRIFRIGDLDAITRKPPKGRAVGHARVSSRQQQAEGDLDRQMARLRAHAGEDLSVFTDVASGLSDRRAGLPKALGECMKPGVDRLIVKHPDRLARFGVRVLEHLLHGYRVNVVYTGQREDESAEFELVRDMLAIVTSFAGRLSGQRSARMKRLCAAVAAETQSGDAA